MRNGLLSFILFCISIQQVSAQKYLLIEKAGNLHTEKIAMYDELTFQIKDDKVGWYTRQIIDMDPAGPRPRRRVPHRCRLRYRVSEW